MKSVFKVFLTLAVFFSLTAPPYTYAAQSDDIVIRVTVLDSPPQGTIVINNGDDYVNSVQVMLAIYAWDTESDVVEMKFSNDGVTWSTPESYAATKDWILNEGDGEKTVYAKYKDATGNWSDACSDTIILYTTTVTTTVIYTYDDLNRLQNAAYGSRSTTYIYDEVGNIMTRNTN